MGREVRRVPANWQHPLDKNGHYVPLFDGADYQDRADEWDNDYKDWSEGWRPEYCKDPASRAMTCEEYFGDRPNRDRYMPTWTEAEATHYQMYETCSEGTPISPVFETPEALAHWLADNNASACGYQTASYDGWLRVALGGFAPTMVISGGIIKSGVESMREIS
jgi:predicted acyl esterase